MAWGKQCNSCKAMNHFSRCCPKSVTNKSLHVVEETSDSDSEPSDDFVCPVTSETVNSVSSGPIYAETYILKIGKK